MRGILLSVSLMVACSASALQTPGPEGDETAATLAVAGNKAMSAGRYAEAQEDFEKVEKAEPSVAEIHATLAAIYFKQKRYDRAIDEIHVALKLKPALPRLDILLGLSLAELGRFDEALPALARGFKQSADPDSRRMCGLQLLRAYTDLNLETDAVETALALNRLYPQDPEVLYNTGRIYGNHANTVMERLHEKAAGSIWMLQAQGESSESQKDYDAAILAFQHVLEIDPRRPGIHYRLGRIHEARFHDTQRPEENEAAMQEFRAELEVNPRNGNAAYESANLLEGIGHVDDAARAYQQVLSNYPDFEEALVGLAGLELHRERPRDAVSLLERATKLRPQDEVAWYRLAQADGATDNREGQKQAMAAFQKLHSFTPAGLRRPDQESDISPQTVGAQPER